MCLYRHYICNKIMRSDKIWLQRLVSLRPNKYMSPAKYFRYTTLGILASLQLFVYMLNLTMFRQRGRYE